MGFCKLVIALGGNALQEPNTPATAESQLKVIKKTCEYIADISCKGYELLIVHGNGPQVGRILLASEAANSVTPVMPLDVCSAMSQGYIGYHIQQSLRKALDKRKKKVPVVTLITQAIVDKNDFAFKNPTKPIGTFFSEEEAEKIKKEKGYVMKEDSGRGWRRVVASPYPKKIVELPVIKVLWDSTICVAAGGGSIPVVEKEDGALEGVAAVIDKDLAAERLAEDVNADIFMILTEVEKVSLNFKKANQIDLDHITVAEAEKYIKEGHFAPGSMLPKVRAALMFAKANSSHKSIITSLYKGEDALESKTGTVITLNR